MTAEAVGAGLNSVETGGGGRIEEGLGLKETTKREKNAF